MAEKSSEKRASGMRSAERLLIVLRALNLRNGATVLELNRDTGISRQAIYRILDTLRNFGYVRRQEATDRFHLTHMVRRLSSGFKDEEWIADIAVPILGRLVQEVVWPTELSTFSDNAMYIRESTRGRSPFTIDRVAVGQRLPMLQSASGRAYLSYCPDPEREAIIENLKSSDDDFDQVAHKPDYIERILAATRSRGWGGRRRFLPAASQDRNPGGAGSGERLRPGEPAAHLHRLRRDRRADCRAAHETSCRRRPRRSPTGWRRCRPAPTTMTATTSSPSARPANGLAPVPVRLTDTVRRTLYPPGRPVMTPP